MRKNKFPGVVLGMSGGIDSAITAAIAADALGPDKVWCVMMPSKYTSRTVWKMRRPAPRRWAASMTRSTSIPASRRWTRCWRAAFAGTKPGITEENIQSRLRAVTLMALSNKFGHMVVTTGNKSEMAVGYATLYGDMCGGYNALKDFYKTEVFELTPGAMRMCRQARRSRTAM